MRERLDALHRVAFLCLVLALAIAAPAIAGDSEDSKERGAPRTGGLEEFDTDGDGHLSKQERAAAQEKRGMRQLEKFDTDGDGHLSKQERAAAREKRHMRQLEEFDTDGDGRISDEERAAAREKRREQRLKEFDTDGDGRISDEEQGAARRKHRMRQGFGPRHRPGVDQPDNAPQEP